jgi:phosphoribosylamine---glycine ligase
MNNLRVLVIGKGGREHALVKALKSSPSVAEVHCAPGNSGMASEALCHALNDSDTRAAIDLCRKIKFDLVVIGPEVPLALGMADELRREGLNVFGPSQAAAELEASKVFAKKFMVAAQIPTASFAEVASVDETLKAADRFQPPYVLKADGLASGKGVFICADRTELGAAARSLFEARSLGVAGQKALLEQHQSGWELSYLILTNGQDYRALPLAQDYKRLSDNDQGPNTGGMGTVAPLEISSGLDEQIHRTILRPAITQIKGMGLDYRGVLFVGIMVTPDGPSVLEFNVRFGDPETQSILPLLEGDWGLVMATVAKGNLPNVNWRPLHLACVVLAAAGYPENPELGVKISGPVLEQTNSSYFLHAGTQLNSDGTWTTAGGRVLNAVGLGNSRSEALKNAYALAAKVSWPGLRLRRDIGRSAPANNQ